ARFERAEEPSLGGAPRLSQIDVLGLEHQPLGTNAFPGLERHPRAADTDSRGEQREQQAISRKDSRLLREAPGDTESPDQRRERTERDGRPARQVLNQEGDRGGDESGADKPLMDVGLGAPSADDDRQEDREEKDPKSQRGDSARNRSLQRSAVHHG